MKKFVATTLLAASLLPSSLTAGVADLVINEIQVANIDVFIDPSFNYGGWVELYNPTDESVSISGLYFSDDASNLKMFRLPTGSGTVPAHGFKNVWFDHYDTGNKYSSVAKRQVDFKLDYDGGTIYISDSRGDLVLSQDYPAGVQRCSYARTTDGGDEWRMCSTPTPAATNEGSTFADEQLPMPEVDTDSQLFTSSVAFNVAIPSGATLRYTTDGSTPTLENGATSTNGRFTVSGQSAVYRFRLFQEGFLPGPVLTRSFIYKDKAYYLPIVSVVTDNANLYDNKIGAYTVGTNGISGQGVIYNTNKNRSWERPVNFEYLVPDDDGGSFLMALNQECDFEVSGGWSRNFQPNASFRLKAAKYYLGQNYFPYAFFKDKPFIRSKGVVVRNGGNDTNGRIRDAGTHKIILTSGFYVDCQEWQPVHVFINGKFQFSFNLREPNNKHHAYANYGIDTDEMDQFEINPVEGYAQRTGDDQAFRRWMALATQLGSNPTNSDLYDQICELVDIDEYCNYMAAECYVGCTDWATNSNNIKGYRDRNDGKFHFVFMDLDSGFGSTSMLSSLASKRNDSRYDTGKNFIIDIFLNMLKHEPFKKRFIDAFCLVNGSVFEEQRCKDIVYAMRDYMQDAMSFEGNASALNGSASTLITGINSGRTARMSSFRSYFGLGRPVTVELGSSIEGATILANGQEVPLGKFKGALQAPMTLTAKGPAGYRFVGWHKASEGSTTLAGKIFDTGSSWFYYDQGSLDGTGWTAQSYATTAWRSGKAPFGYGNVGINGSQDYATTLDYGTDANNKRPTYYFRKTFRLAQAPTSADLYMLNGYVDDGCVVYVNGHEAGRYLMPAGTITYETFSTTYAGATAGECSFTFDNQWLRAGDNVIAVEIHNTHEHSSDIYWTAELQHYTRGEDVLLTEDSLLVLDSYTGQDLGKVVATYEALPDDALLAAAGTPIKVNEVSAGNGIFVNEFFKRNDWFELYNTTDTELNVAGLYVSDDINDPQRFQIPSASAINTYVPAHGHLVLWADNLESTTQIHTGFKLGNNDGEVILVTSSDDFVANNAAYFEAHPQLTEFTDILAYPAHASDQTVGRYPDGANTFFCMARPTIGRPNTITSYDILVGQDESVVVPPDHITVPEETVSEDLLATAPSGYYTLSGLFLSSRPDHLRPGLYIVRGTDGSSRKVFIH